MDANIANILEYSSQHIKDFKLAIEFKYLMKNAPAGVYLLPEVDDIRSLHGVIFLRRGLYRGGIFRFTVKLPFGYNDSGMHPEIRFTPPIFNPLVDPVSGVLDLKIDPLLQAWQPERHFIVTAITFLKKIFYMKSYDQFQPSPNPTALNLFMNDKDEFLNHVHAAVEASLSRVYELPQGIAANDCTLTFTESKPAHEDIINNVLLQSARSLERGDDVPMDDMEASFNELDDNISTTLSTSLDPMNASNPEL